MNYTYLHPSANGVVQLTPTPAARANWECVNNFPTYPPSQHVSAVNATLEDLYSITMFPTSYDMLKIRSVELHASAMKTSHLAAAGVRVSVKPSGGSTYYSPENVLDYTQVSNATWVWEENPHTAEAWTITDLTALQCGIKLYSAAATTTARCFQLAIKLNIEIAGALLSNDPRIPSTLDYAFQTQGFSVIATMPGTVDIYQNSEIKLRALLPNGNTVEFNGLVLNGNSVFASIPSATLTSNAVEGIVTVRPHVKIGTLYLSGEPNSIRVKSQLI